METLQTDQQIDGQRAWSSKEEKGQAMIEMVLIMPLILLIMAGVIDFGRVIHAYVVVVNAAREAAFAGAVEQVSDSDLVTLIADELQRGGVTEGTATSTITYQSQGSPTAQTINVDISYEFPLITLVLPFPSVTVQTQTETVTFW
jgi:Flp pilus assembly protein TadG